MCDIQERLKIAASTLSHHIATLRYAGLVIQRREGQGILVSSGYKTMTNLITYLTEECCTNVEGWGHNGSLSIQQRDPETLSRDRSSLFAHRNFDLRFGSA